MEKYTRKPISYSATMWPTLKFPSGAKEQIDQENRFVQQRDSTVRNFRWMLVIDLQWTSKLREVNFYLFRIISFKILGNLSRNQQWVARESAICPIQVTDRD